MNVKHTIIPANSMVSERQTTMHFLRAPGVDPGLSFMGNFALLLKKTSLRVLLLVCLLYGLPATAQRNVVLIIADDLGTDYLGFYEDHQDTVDVPNIRALLKKGVRFTNGMSNPVCSSTRSGILTGRYSFRTGVGGVVGGTGGSNPLDTSELTIPKQLKNFNPGIARANIGKWHLHQPVPASNLLNPLRMGYEYFEGPFIGQLPSYTNWTKYTDGVTSTVTTYATTENVNNAVTWLKQQSNRPVFLWLAFNAPHAPYHLPPSNLHTYTGLSGTTQDITKNPKAYFKAMLQSLDTEIGRLMDSLKSMNRYDSTDFIFIGDNGNTIQTAQISNKSKAKGTVYQYGVHVPFIISGPSVVKPGRVSDALVNTVDIHATVLELFGYMDWKNAVSPSKPVDTKSILPIIKNTVTEIRPWSFCELFQLTGDSSDGKAIRNKQYKLIRFDYGAEEFYDLSADPQENTNLLRRTLSATEKTNYTYLCTEFANLLSKSDNCSITTGIQTPSPDLITGVFPNPFRDHLGIPSHWASEEVRLTDLTGNVIYQGKAIGSVDLTRLQPGIYLLARTGGLFETYRLIKQP